MAVKMLAYGISRNPECISFLEEHQEVEFDTLPLLDSSAGTAGKYSEYDCIIIDAVAPIALSENRVNQLQNFLNLKQI